MREFNRILLGRVAENADTYADGKCIYLTKHKWDCGWYWSFGYIGNRGPHFHFNTLFMINGDNPTASELFSKTKFSDDEWWVLRDLFKQAYALQKAAEVYQYGGRQITRTGTTDIIKNKKMADMINADLKIVLDTAWDFACNIVNRK